MGKSEATVANLTRAEFSSIGELWRNNVGVLKDKRGVPVRYGLCNDTAQLNKKLKSADLIGITPVTITPEMVGQTLGVFTAFETKPEDWSFSNADEHAWAQRRWHDIVRNVGGYAGFVTNPNDVYRIIKRG